MCVSIMYGIVYLPLNVRYCLQMRWERDKVTRLPGCILLFTSSSNKQLLHKWIKTMKNKFHSPSWSHSLPQRPPPCLHLCIFQRQCGPTDMSLSLCTCVYMCTYMCIYTCVRVYSITHTRCLLLCTKTDADSPLCSASLTSWCVLLMLLSGLYQKLLGS